MGQTAEFAAGAWIVRQPPNCLGKPLRGEKHGLWRYRVGDYRVICHIEDEMFVVLALRIAHRKKVYR